MHVANLVIIMAQRQRLSDIRRYGGSGIGELSERSYLFGANPLDVSHHCDSQITVNQRTEVADQGDVSQSSVISSSETLHSLAQGSYRVKNYCRASSRRLPKGKGVLLVYAIYFLETIAFYSTLAGLQHILLRGQPESIWIFTLLDGTAGRVVYPVAGVIADTYLGRYQVIQIGLWLLWIGFAILALSQALIMKYHASTMVGYVLPILSAVVISIGAGSVEVNAISFGVDQITQGAPSDEISSYFYWFYFHRNVGALITTTLSILIFGIPDLSTQYNGYTLYAVQSLFAVSSISIALVLHYHLQNWYFRDRNRENPLKSIINVLYFSATVKRHPPIHRRAFRIGEGKKPRIELAKIDYDGIFSGEEVENVKTFCQILFLIFTLGGYFATFGAAYSMLGYQINASTIAALGVKSSYFASNFLSLINTITFIIFLPVLNHILIPFMTGFTMKLRIGFGVICSLVCVAVAAILVQDNRFSSWWLILPAILISLGDALTVVTGVEFIYAQSPETMKGLLTGSLYLGYGVFRGLGIVFFHFYSSIDLQRSDVVMCFYVIFSVVAGLGFVMYFIVACLYSNRKRPTGDDSEDDLIRRDLAQNVYAN